MSRRETRVPGRRTLTDRPRGRSRTTVLAAMVVVLTAAVLALAGTTQGGPGSRIQAAKRVEPDQRTFACSGGIPGSTVVHGTVSDGQDGPKPVGDHPQPIAVDQKGALDAFAGQESRTKDWLAWLPCPEPRARWWFVAAGAAVVTHDTVLTVTNPRVGQADVDIDVYGPRGPVQAPGLHGITVGSGQSRVVDLAKVAPAVGDLAVSVVATRGLVAVSAADRFAPGVVGKPAQEWLPAQSAPATTVTLAGLPPKPDRASLVVVNPRQVEAIVSVEVIGATGTFAPKQNQTLTVPPGSVATASLTSVFDGGPMAVQVRSQQPVTATVRTVTGGDVSFATGVRSIRDSTTVAVPQGTGRLVLSSVGPATTVTVTAFGRRGNQLQQRSVAVPKAGSAGFDVPGQTAYLRLAAGSAGAVAGFSVTDPAGVATAGVSPAIRSVLMAAVRPGW